MKLSIKKRIFGSICGRPGFCSHIFAKLGSRPDLVDFLLNCLLRNALFGQSAVFEKLGSRLELVGFLLNCLLRNAFFGRSAVVRAFVVTFLQNNRLELVGFLLTVYYETHFLIDLR